MYNVKCVTIDKRGREKSELVFRGDIPATFTNERAAKMAAFSLTGDDLNVEVVQHGAAE